MSTKGAWPKEGAGLYEGGGGTGLNEGRGYKGGGVIKGGLKEAELSQGAGTRQWAGLCRLEVSMKGAWPNEGGGVI